ncbi:complement factor H-related protein 3-like isoform X4 [Phyllostomus hastatus]|uniref:complement factor H-related protein 3-like isoform X4 n=1 Tax=Phyllostomus hastatus TaxID=9423 RepID=UPI001E68212E|nr:complement factor H-related protein 3-like isoform X4 [Phyllostomus hastatus]
MPNMLLSLISVIVTLWVSQAHGQETTCDPPTIAHGLYTQNRTKYRLEDVITYRCDNGFSPLTRRNETRCTDGGWAPPPRCIRKCVFNYLEHGHSPPDGQTYLQGQSVSVTCHPDYSLPNQQTTMTCMENGWSPPPKCIKKKAPPRYNLFMIF